MRGLKGLLTIWFLVLITLIAGFWWMNWQIDQDIHKSQSQGLRFAETLYLQDDCLYGALECQGLDYQYPTLRWAKAVPYTVTSYGTVRLQLTASDASHQWGDNPMQDMDMDSRKLQGSQ